MNRCNDPTCPLNRQGLVHENHESIASRPITDPCEDSRCGLNRMGLRHNVHDHVESDSRGGSDNNNNNYNTASRQEHFSDQDSRQADYDNSNNSNRNNDNTGGDDIDYDDLLDRLGKHAHNHDRSYEEHIISEDTKQERQKIEQEAQEEIRRQAKNKSSPQRRVSPRSAASSRRNSDTAIPSINQILHITDPYKIFNVTQDTTCAQIKARFKKLSKNYNASRGSAHRTHKEQQLLTKVQSKINLAYDFLSKRHCS